MNTLWELTSPRTALTAKRSSSGISFQISVRYHRRSEKPIEDVYNLQAFNVLLLANFDGAAHTLYVFAVYTQSHKTASLYLLEIFSSRLLKEHELIRRAMVATSTFGHRNQQSQINNFIAIRDSLRPTPRRDIYENTHTLIVYQRGRSIYLIFDRIW